MRIRGVHSAAGVVGAVAAVTLAACSPSLQQPSDLPPGSEVDVTIEAPASSAPADAGGEEAGACAIGDFKVEGQSGREPTIVVPEDCEPPAEVLSKDLDSGNGPSVKKGDTVEVNYVIVGVESGKRDSSWTSKTQSERKVIDSVGDGEVVPGWDDALVGMKAGGRKLVVLPPEEGAGAEQGEDLGFDEDETVAMVIGLTRVG